MLLKPMLGKRNVNMLYVAYATAFQTRDPDDLAKSWMAIKVDPNGFNVKSVGSGGE